MLNTSRISRYFLLMGVLPRCGFLFCSFLFCNNVLAERCEPLPDNEYEKIFCDLKRAGRGATLPNIYQFRDNTPLTQALLLKKPAERAGIKMNIPERDNQDTLRRQEELLMLDAISQQQGPVRLNSAVTKLSVIQQPKVVSIVDVQKTAEKPIAEINAIVEKNAVVEKRTYISLPVCKLQQLTLQCANGSYQLVGNKTNQQLSDKALSDEHKLGLPVYTGSVDDVKSLEDYLAKAYDRYLAGMIEIGLGASTMSYTKFANLHQYIVQQHLNFAGRFETMYTFLKKDKAAIGVSTKLAIAEGFSPENCSQLENFMACDYLKNNYIFVKLAP